MDLELIFRLETLSITEILALVLIEKLLKLFLCVYIFLLKFIVPVYFFESGRDFEKKMLNNPPPGLRAGLTRKKGVFY